MKRNSPLRRYKPPRRVRKRVGEETVGKTGRIRLRGKKLQALRLAVFQRDGYRCQWEGCGKLLDWDGPNAGHMSHLKSRGAGGDDSLANTRLLCAWHHIGMEHTKGKSSEPSKPLSDL